jgi:hypothetical protein
MCASNKWDEPAKQYWFLANSDAHNPEAGEFLRRQDMHPLFLVDLAGGGDLLHVISSGGEVPKDMVQGIIDRTLGLMVDVYDGTADLKWIRKSREEMRALREASNIHITA